MLVNNTSLIYDAVLATAQGAGLAMSQSRKRAITCAGESQDSAKVSMTILFPTCEIGTVAVYFRSMYER